jgi:cell division protein FtsI (penicillin-binding protein 3)
MEAKKLILLRTRVAFLGVVALCFVILVRLVYIQLIERPRWESAASENSLQYRTIKATRGNIYANGGQLLATSMPLFKVAIDPVVIPADVYQRDIDSLTVLLSHFFKDLTPREYFRKINNARVAGKRYIVLNNEPVNFKDKKRLEAWPLFREGQRRGGVIFEKVERRSYPYGQTAARVIGYVQEDSGRVGLEYSFDRTLAGINGNALYQRVSGSEWKPVSDFSQMVPTDGYDLYTTLDIDVQEIAAEELKKALEEHQADFGCVIVMEVKTGYIRAMANFGRNLDGDYVENYNYAVGEQGSTDPGSTFKLASAIALFEDNPMLELSDTIETGGGTYNFYGATMRDARAGGFGRLTIQQVFEQSSNVGVSKLITRQFGERPADFVNKLYEMQLGAALNFQLKGVAKPYIKTPEDKTWSATSLPWMSVGYEMRLSPLHTLTLYNAIANGGRMMQPQIVREVRRATQPIEQFVPSILSERICNDTTLQKVQAILEGVVQRGTARAIRSNQYRIAGKTGTSQKIDPKTGRYSPTKYYTSFAGYFPAEAPKYTCIVVIDSPRGFKQYGADVSAPVFRKVADRLYVRDLEMQQSTEALSPKQAFQTNIPADQVAYQQDVRFIMRALNIPSAVTAESEWVVPIAQPMQVSWKERSIQADRVPNVIGMSLRDALYILENRGFKVYFEGRGKVKTQSLMPGSALPSNKRIVLSLQ